MRRRITEGTGNSSRAERSTRSPSHSSTNTVFLNVMITARATLTVPSGSYVWLSSRTLSLSAILGTSFLKLGHLSGDRNFGARGETRTHESWICSPAPWPLGDARKLERKERFELSSRVWKTRMFPATSLPRRGRRLRDYLRHGCGVRSVQIRGLALHANHVLDLGDDFNQIFLVLHHRFDRFVSARNFIQHAYVLATFNARRLTLQVVFRKRTLRCATRHLATSTVRARVKTLSHSATANDVRLGAHRSRDDAERILDRKSVGRER